MISPFVYYCLFSLLLELLLINLVQRCRAGLSMIKLLASDVFKLMLISSFLHERLKTFCKTKEQTAEIMSPKK